MANEDQTLGIYALLLKLIQKTPAPVLMTIFGAVVYVYGAAGGVQALRIQDSWRLSVTILGAFLSLFGVILVAWQLWYSFRDRRVSAALTTGPVPSTTKSQDDFHTFCGLKEQTRGDDIFQDFEMVREGENINAVQFLWADTFRGSHIRARVDLKEKCLRIDFKNEPESYPCNVAIRAKEEMALTNNSHRPVLGFEARIPKDACETKNLLKKISVSIRLVNGSLQHWEYSDRPRECKQFLVDSTEWKPFSVKLESALWYRFDSDGNHSGGSNKPDFSVICCVIFEVGSPTARSLPGSGTGAVEIKRIRLRSDS